MRDRDTTYGARIVDAIAEGNPDKLRDALHNRDPQDLEQVFVEINRANSERQAASLVPVIVIVNDADGDGRVDASGTSIKTGKTIAAEG